MTDTARPTSCSADRFLAAIADEGARQLERHAAQRRDWSYHDILDREALHELSARPPVEVDDDTALAFLGNLVVEKGHAEYDRVVSEALGGHPVFRQWKNVWVAEEEPHGAAMLEWAKARGLLDMARAHRCISGFLRNGLTLSYPEPATMLAYGTLQEAATRITHKRVKDRLPASETHGRRLLANIIADEERHERFYANMVRHALQSGDPEVVSCQVEGLARVVLGFEMPGIERDVPESAEIGRAYRASGVFTVGHVVREVLVPAASGTSYGWGMTDVGPLTASADARREQLLTFAEHGRAINGERGERAYLRLVGRARRLVP